MANSIPKIVYDAGAGDVTIQFEYPPQGLDFEGKNYSFVDKVSESTNGKYQSSENYTEDERNFTFKQVKETIANQVETFFLTHGGSKRKSFKYYIHSDEVDFLTVQISKGQKGFRPKRTGWASSNNEKTYEFKLSIRRAL